MVRIAPGITTKIVYDFTCFPQFPTNIWVFEKHKGIGKCYRKMGKQWKLRIPTKTNTYQ